jgi:hypothetical protein
MFSAIQIVSAIHQSLAPAAFPSPALFAATFPASPAIAGYALRAASFQYPRQILAVDVAVSQEAH